MTSPVAAVENVKQGRADAFMFDDTLLLGIAANDPSLKMTGHKFLNVPYGIGIRKGETAMKRWVDSRLELMRKKDTFMGILRNNVPDSVISTEVPCPANA